MTVNGRLLELPSLLVGAGLRVDVVGGWEERGKPQMRPQGVVLHHTAAPQGRNAPSLAVVIDGRVDLKGPLCHVLIGRDGTCHIIASGVANHAGDGGWQGLVGNRSVVGIEIEHEGTAAEPWSRSLVDTSLRCAAAIADGYCIPTVRVCAHKEWAPQRKIDPYGWDMTVYRPRIQRIRDSARPVSEDEDMADPIEQIHELHVRYLKADHDPHRWAIDMLKSFDFHLWRLTTGTPLDTIRGDFARTAGI